MQEIRGARVAAEGALIFSHLAQWVQPVLVNGAAGIVSRLSNGKIFAIMCFTVKDNRIAEMDVIRNSDRLHRLDLTDLN
ncbi:MAG TPA: hypothetical protein VGK64_30085 [Bryobacteraceae bacterium]